jgi:hypothetical protein
MKTRQLIAVLLHSTNHKDRTAAVMEAEYSTLIAGKTILGRLTTDYNGYTAAQRIESELVRRDRMAGAA